MSRLERTLRRRAGLTRGLIERVHGYNFPSPLRTKDPSIMPMTLNGRGPTIRQ
jgi:hypothetical protein